MINGENNQMTSVSPDLTGEIALITGCAGLLGPVHADALIRCGTFVVVTDIDEERARETAHRLADEHGRLVLKYPVKTAVSYTHLTLPTIYSV